MTTTIGFFNFSGDMGKNLLVYHLAEMYSELGKSVLVVDADPHAYTSTLFLEDETLERVWNTSQTTLFDALVPYLQGKRKPRKVAVETVGEGVHLLVGSYKTSRYEAVLEAAWAGAVGGEATGLAQSAGFYQAIQTTAKSCDADIILVDIPATFSAMSRAALLASDGIILPLAPDLFSTQGLSQIADPLRQWREEWQISCQGRSGSRSTTVPKGDFNLLGYVLQHYATRRDQPLFNFARWTHKIEDMYAEQMADLSVSEGAAAKLATLKHYRTLLTMAMQAHKPLFALKPADGAMGASVPAVIEAYRQFKRLAVAIMEHPALSQPRKLKRKLA